jgi:hypothetical protein
MPAYGGVEDKCYGKFLGNCDGGLSREHYISEALLNHFDKLSPKGIPWLRHVELESLSSNALTTKCLCSRHNSYLSPLDDFIDKFFTQLKHFYNDVLENTVVNISIIEKWMLKALVGLLASKQMRWKGRQYTVEDIDLHYLEVLFGLKEMPSKQGLFIQYKVGDKIEAKNAFSIAPIYAKDMDSKICGLETVFAGLKIYFLTIDIEVVFGPPVSGNYPFRPGVITKQPTGQQFRFKK